MIPGSRLDSARLSRDAAWTFVLAIVWCDSARSEGHVPDRVLPAIVDATPAKGCGRCPACVAVASLRSSSVPLEVAERRAYKAARGSRRKLCQDARTAFERVRSLVQ